MVLRRLIENVNKQTWVAVCLELVVVIVGIFLGLQASSWYERHQEMALEASILARLRSEFSQISADTEGAVRFHQYEVEALDRIVQSLQRGKLAPENESDFRDAFGGAMNYHLVPSRAGTYVEIISSGQFRLLKDPELRAALILYDDRVSTAQSLFSNLFLNQSRQQPILNRHFERRPVVETPTDWAPTGKRLSRGKISDFDFDAMAADQEFIISIEQLIDIHIWFQSWHTNLSHSADEVLDLLGSSN